MTAARHAADLRWLVLMLVTACGAPAGAPVSEAPTPVPVPVVEETPAMTEVEPETQLPAKPVALTAEEAATRFYTAMVAADADAMRALTVTYDEMRSLSHKDKPREDFEERVEAFIASRVREFTEVKARFVRVEVVDERTLLASENEKIKHDLPVAEIAAVVEADGKERQGPPMLFLNPGNGFKLSPMR